MDKRRADELLAAYKGIKDVRINHRIHAVMLVLVDGYDEVQVAAICKRKTSWVREWVARYESEGLDGLSDRPRSGRPPRADPEKLAVLVCMMCEAGTQAELVRKAIFEMFGVRYSITHVRHLMRTLGYSDKKMTPYHTNKATVQERLAWQRHLAHRLPHMIKNNYTLLHFDEMHYSPYQSSGGRVWSPRGGRHYEKWSSSRKKRCVYGGPGLKLGRRGHRRVQFFRTRKKFTAKEFTAVFRQIAAKYGGKIWLFLDRATPHRSKIFKKILKEYPMAVIENFPTGCPEYNGSEQCWNEDKARARREGYKEMFAEVVSGHSEFLRTNRFDNIDPIAYMFRKPMPVQYG